MELYKHLKCLKLVHLSAMLIGVIAFGQQKKDSQIFDDSYNIQVEVNGVLLELKFDTGSATTLLYSSVIDEKYKDSLQVVSKQGFTDGFGNTETSNVYKGIQFKANIIQDLYPTFIFSEQEKLSKFLTCIKAKNKGIVGMSAFFNSEKNTLLGINHDSSKVRIINKQDLNLSNYIEIDTDFRDNSIYIDSKIEGKNMELLFDTGYEGFILINKKFRKLRKYDEIENLKSMSATLFSMQNGKEITLQGPEVNLAGIKLPNSIVSINSNNTVPILGAKIINKFNWIIDFKNEKVYLQKREDVLSVSLADKLEKQNIAIAVNGMLFIVSSFQPEFKTGSIIKSIQNKTVTTENICELQNLLNEHGTDWTTLKIKIK